MKILRLPIALLVFCYVYSCYAELDEDTFDQLNAGITAATTTADKFKEQRDALKEKGKAISPFINGIGKIAPFLGVAGVLFSALLSYLPKEDSDELKYMKTQFAKVNWKLDNIAHKLGDIKTLITYETQRSSYITAEQNIILGFEKLNEFYDELHNTQCKNARECKYTKSNIASKYLDEFIEVGFSLDQILKGSIGTAIFGEPILDLFKTRYNCEVGKLSQYMENIISIAAKGLQVKIATEKLTGSEISMALSTKRYFKSIYDLRNYYYIKKNECFKNLKTYFSKDIKDTKYQTDYSDHKAANTALRESLENKYSWLRWNVLSYNVEVDNGPIDYAVKVNDGSVSNPSTGQKTVIVATPVDPEDKYTKERHAAVKEAIPLALDKTVYQCSVNKSKCIEVIEDKIKDKNIANYIQSISVMKKEIIPTITSTAKEYSYIDDIFELKSTKQARASNAVEETISIRVVIMLRSVEMGATECNKQCHTSKCVRLPFSKASECQCKTNFDGEGCEEQNGLESSLKGHLNSASLMKVPTIVDMYNNVEDLKDVMNAEISQLDNTMGALKLSMENSYEKNDNKLSQKFQGTGIRIDYRKTIRDIIFYSKKLKETKDITRKKELATYVLKVENIQSWINDLNDLFLGSTSLLYDDTPLMITLMNKFSEGACSNDYKKLIDDGFKEFNDLQDKAFKLLEDALIIELKDPVMTVIAKKLKKKNKRKQKKELAKKTCSYFIENSANVKCTEDSYIHPAMSFKNKCEANYYAKGPIESKCNDDEKSSCDYCSCDPIGSVSSQCDDQTGKCQCKVEPYHSNTKRASYDGDKCESRDCKWSLWSPFTRCSQSCGYGGIQSRVRYIEIKQHGTGEICSESDKDQERNCSFKSCCNNQFHCSKEKKCISSSSECNYYDDCGDKEDEDDELCQESCETKETSWSEYGLIGKKEYLQKKYQQPSCVENWAMQSFQLEKKTDIADSYLRYKFRCCMILNVGFKVEKKLKCPDKSYINGFVYEKSDSGTYSMYYNCNVMDSRDFRERTTCQQAFTAWNEEGDKTDDLTHHLVDCQTLGTRWFLNGVELETKHSTKQMRYKYQCCRINA